MGKIDVGVDHDNIKVGIVGNALYMHWVAGASTARSVSELKENELESLLTLLKTEEFSAIFDVNGKIVGLSLRNIKNDLLA